ncbi:MAG: hypothetical protein KGH66_01385 [Candidatus Micrarchaeota archaeon]|nr:hypothetical protein [Candidatus Micrarchaeota archaeon]
MFGAIASIVIAFISMFVPGVLLAYSLLRKTELHMFEILVIGLIFGMIFPAAMTWAESYLMNYIHWFSFSLGLFEANAAALTIFGLIAVALTGGFGPFAKAFGAFITEKKIDAPQPETHAHHQSRKQTPWWVWAILIVLMLTTFYTRIINISVAPTFFEFDPYFDMLATQSILTFGSQFYLSTSAWPAVAGGTVMRIQPLMPYLEAYWYDLANAMGPHYTSFSTSLLSNVSSVYPPITAALLVFAMFMLLYHEYDAKIALIGAAFTATMPVLLTSFIAGEQLLEPWGIFSLFFFFAAYMLAIRNPKSKSLAILAGLAFVSTFLGAHYYTVDAGILAIYILLQGVIDVIRQGKVNMDFYKMNGIVLIVIAIFLALYEPYNAVYGGGIPSILGIPTTIAFPILSLVLVAVMEQLVKRVSPMIQKNQNALSRLAVVLAILIVVALLVLLTPLGKPVQGYLKLSTNFTTPSKALFMTVQEYIPTGLLYNFGAAGFGAIGANIFGLPLFVWIVSIMSIIMLVISIVTRASRTAVLYLGIAIPLMFAGFSEVKYLPHFGVAYIMLFFITIGELAYFYHGGKRLAVNSTGETTEHFPVDVYKNHKQLMGGALLISLFLLFGVLVLIVSLIYFIAKRLFKNLPFEKSDRNLIILTLVLFIFPFLTTVLISHSGTFLFSESSSFIQLFTGAAQFAGNPSIACNSFQINGNVMGANLFCNQVQSYWISATAWMRANVGPYAPRILAWWDYGDWINWFGSSNAVLRGDNAYAQEDYGTAANFVLGPKYNYTPKTLANYMNTNQSKYVLFDQDLISKWQALDFLGCVNINATSRAFAIGQGALQNPPVPYMLGNSQCEINNDPQFVLVPYAALVPQAGAQQNINTYCSISNGTNVYARAFLVSGNSIQNQSVCVSTVPNKNGVLQVYNTSGGAINMVIQTGLDYGTFSITGVQVVQFLAIYLPNGPGGTITDAPSDFYNSNFYKGFFLLNMSGFTLAYPSGAHGINMVNGTYPIVIYSLNNYTGTLPAVPTKPSWVHNNYTMP